MARKRSSKASEENLPLFCVKTQISFVRNVSGAPFPLRMAPQAAKALGKQLAAWVAKFVARAEDLTEDALLADAGEVVYGLTPRKERGPGYRLLRLTSSDGLVVWCELMSANHLTFSVCGDFLDFGARTEALRHFVDALAEPVGFAYDERLGYLTAQTSLVGTGLRIRSWMHLGGLAHFGYLRELCNASWNIRTILRRGACSFCSTVSRWGPGRRRSPSGIGRSFCGFPSKRRRRGGGSYATSLSSFWMS